MNPTASLQIGSTGYVENLLLLYAGLYGVTSRLPYLLFAIHAKDHLDLGLKVSAGCLCLYTLGRLASGHVAGSFASVHSIFVGTVIALVSWVAIIIFRTSGPVFIIACFFIGFTEVITGAEVLLKLESTIGRRTQDQLQTVFHAENIMISFGTFVGFLAGGFTYQHWESLIPSASLCCGCCALKCVILGLIYCRRPIYQQMIITLEDIKNEVNTGGRKSAVNLKNGGADSRVSVANIHAVVVEDEEDEDINGQSKGTKHKIDPFASSDSCLCMGVASFFFTTIGMSAQYGVNTLFWQDRNQGPVFVGTLMCGGEMLGLVLQSLLSRPHVFNSAATFHFGKPMNICFTSILVGVGLLLILVPNDVVAGLGVIAVSTCSVLLHSFQADFLAVLAHDKNYSTLLALGLGLKRLNTLIVVGGMILLFNISKEMSYLVAAGCAIFYGIFSLFTYMNIGALPFQRWADGFISEKLQDAQGSAGTFDFCLIVYNMCCAAGSHMLLVVFAVNSVRDMKFDYPEIACALALFFCGKLFGAELAGKFVGVFAMMFGVLCAGGFWTVLLFTNCSRGLPSLFYIAIFVFGFADMSSSVGTLMKVEGLITRRTLGQQRTLSKANRAAGSFGAILGMIASGILYARYPGFFATGVVSIGILFAALFSLVCAGLQRSLYTGFVTMAKILVEAQNVDKMMMARSKKLGVECSITTVRTRINLDGITQGDGGLTNDGGQVNVCDSAINDVQIMEPNESDKPQTFMQENDPLGSHAAIAMMTFGGFALSVVGHANFAITGLHYKDNRDFGVDSLCYCLALGETLAVFSYLFLSMGPVSRNPIVWNLGKPVNIGITLFCLGVACLAVAMELQSWIFIGTFHYLFVLGQDQQAEAISTTVSKSLKRWTHRSRTSVYVGCIGGVSGFLACYDQFGFAASFGFLTFFAMLSSLLVAVVCGLIGSFPHQRVANKLVERDIRPTDLSEPETLMLLYSIPYAFVSRLPFTVLAVHMIRVMGWPFLRAGSTLGLYCFGRLIGAHIAGRYVGMLTLMFGTVCGIFSWIFMGFIPNDDLFVVSAFALGFTETVTGLDTMLKIECVLNQKPPAATQIVFRMQLIFTCIGVFIGYSGAGWLYERTYLLEEIAVASILNSVLCVIFLLLLMRCRSMYRVPFIRVGHVDHEMQLSQFGNKSDVKTRVSVVQKNEKQNMNARVTMVDHIEMVDDEEDQINMKTGLSEKPLLTAAFLWTICACFYFTTLGISSQFAIAALFWKVKWNYGPMFVGSLMAAGEGIGVLALVVFSQPIVFYSPLTFHFGRPINVIVTCTSMALMCCTMTIYSVPVAAVSTVGMHILNVCIHSFQAEIIGACAPQKDFAWWISVCYVLKRFANCCCVFGSLVFFGLLGPDASYYGVGFCLICWAAILGAIYLFMGAFPFQRQMRPDGKKSLADLLSKIPVHQLQEMQAQAKVEADVEKPKLADEAPAARVSMRSGSSIGSSIQSDGSQQSVKSSADDLVIIGGKSQFDASGGDKGISLEEVDLSKKVEGSEVDGKIVEPKPQPDSLQNDAIFTI